MLKCDGGLNAGELCANNFDCGPSTCANDETKTCGSDSDCAPPPQAMDRVRHANVQSLELTSMVFMYNLVCVLMIMGAVHRIVTTMAVVGMGISMKIDTMSLSVPWKNIVLVRR